MSSGVLWCDAQVVQRNLNGTVIGMATIKRRRLMDIKLPSHPDLYVGQCVPFYFCARSVMLYLLHRSNHSGVSFKGGQGAILHLEADLKSAVRWALQRGKRWAFTLSNAGAFYFEDRSSLDALVELDWHAISTKQWSGRGVDRLVKERKQAEFLIERCFPWSLVQRIGVQNQTVYTMVMTALSQTSHKPQVEIKPDWYY